MLWDWVKQGNTTYNTTKAQAEEFFGISKGNAGSSPRLSKPSYSQFNKNVKLILYAADGTTSEYVFPVNPEDFDYNRPERVRVTQTLGDPFIDDFGIGMPTLNVKGTTGWRTRPGINGKDGHGAFRELHRDFFDRFFKLREDQISAGGDPDQIKLWVVNNVDQMSFAVVPTDFKLLRSKSRPLLYQYDLSFTVVKDLTQLQSTSYTDPLSVETNWQDAFRERHPYLSNSIDVAQSLIDSVENGYRIIHRVLTPVFEAASVFIGGLGAVLDVMDLGANHVASIINGVANKLDTALNAVRNTQEFINDLPLEIMLAINHLQSSIHEIECYLSKGAQDSWLPDFSPIEGVSDCATTRGINPGSVAADILNNGVEWVAELAENAIDSDISNVIGFVQGSATLSSVSTESTAPVQISQDLGSSLDNMNSVAQDMTDFQDVKAVLGFAVDVMNSVTFDETLVSNSISENLVKISQFKTVIVTDGDSLQSIALAELGSADRWREIAAVNDIVVEGPAEIFQPIRTFTVDTDLVAGDNVIDYGSTVPESYVAAGYTIKLTDANGKKQTMIVKSIDDTEINLGGTFSQSFTGPITITSYVNRAGLGVYDYSTWLAAEFPVGSYEMEVEKSKDIHIGYSLYLQGDQGVVYTVTDVNYLENIVTVDKASVGFADETEVQIYDSTSRLHNMTPGLELKIPMTSGVSMGLSQTESQIYGGDLAMDEQGRLSAVDGDMAILTGLDNLKQAIYHRIICPYGSLVIHPEYGCLIDTIVGRKNSERSDTLARATLIDALSNEPRINLIRSFDTRIFGDVLAVAIVVESIDKNTSTDLNFVVEV